MFQGLRYLNPDPPNQGLRVRDESFAVSSAGGGGGSGSVSGFVYRSYPTSAYRSVPIRPYRSYPIG